MRVNINILIMNAPHIKMEHYIGLIGHSPLYISLVCQVIKTLNVCQEIEEKKELN